MALIDGLLAVKGAASLLRTVLIVFVSFILLSMVIRMTRSRLLHFAKSKKQKTNVEHFMLILKYGVFFILVMVAIASYSGAIAGLGIGVGFLSAALGWALQKPITGIAAWIMVVTKRPFRIGDRIVIGSVKGDVVDISLTHTSVQEIGGTAGGEEPSGRVILIPNSILFEQNITNYTDVANDNDLIVDTVSFTITFHSNLSLAMDLSLRAAEQFVGQYAKVSGKNPFVRTYIKENGMQLVVKYKVPTKEIQEKQSAISKYIYEHILASRDIQFAHPHMHVIHKDARHHTYPGASTIQKKS